ncbi:MAG: methyltransferase domain-containing protein [Desulfovibrio sp.]|uniref:class I SAM-dependent methyltransferase n=1 Tax=Desulfovibrio sp. TaxID=885 RepID=UPI001A7A324F|nr:methyltransferase domain-containing protein [Desulfovibrio sp.]MBD5418126.1 methyltransferase domain-containing protein [Desulfovibrio sp.]
MPSAPDTAGAREAAPSTAPATQNELDGLLANIRKTFDADFEPLQVDDGTLDVLTVRDMPRHLDALLRRGAIHDPMRDLPLWAKVWPGSFVLGRFLRTQEPQGKRLLEIGAGCAICSMVAARYGFAHIVASDNVADALTFARANVLKNHLEDRIEVRHLDVTTPGQDARFPGGFDIIAASELLYLDDLHRPLLKFLERHLAPGGKALFCTDLARAKPRFAKLAAKSFNVQEGKIGVKTRDEEGAEQRRIYSVCILERP